MPESSSQRPSPGEDVKRKFREALDRKHPHAGKNVSDTHDRSKVDHAHGPETTSRQQIFRRKSG